MPWFMAKSDGYYTLRDIIMTRCVRYSSAVICAVGALLRTTNCGLCCSTHTCCRGCCCSVIKDFIGVDKWLAHHYPKLKETALKPIECVQNSGDVVYLPARWEACPSPPHSPPLPYSLPPPLLPRAAVSSQTSSPAIILYMCLYSFRRWLHAIVNLQDSIGKALTTRA